MRASPGPPSRTPSVLHVGSACRAYPTNELIEGHASLHSTNIHSAPILRGQHQAAGGAGREGKVTHRSQRATHWLGNHYRVTRGCAVTVPTGP